jgi:ATP-binding cassette subfamily B protein
LPGKNRATSSVETVLGNWFEDGDEPTSALDTRAECQVFEAFRQSAASRTAILISHRFSTVRLADRIYVLDEGRIVESGSHDELLEYGGTYARMFETQAQYCR